MIATETRNPPASIARPFRIHLLLGAALSLVTIACFLPALQNGFVNWDDYGSFIANAKYRGVSAPNLKWMFTTALMGHYIPLTWLSLGLDYQVWGMNPFGYHLTSLLLHTSNALLFYFLAVRLFRATGKFVNDDAALQIASCAATLFFAIHPLRVESVAWVTERRDVLSGFFYLSSALLYVRYATASTRVRLGFYSASLICFAFAILAKGITVTLPVILLLLDVFPLRRLAWTNRPWKNAAIRRVLLEKVPFFLLSALGSIATLLALTGLRVSLTDLSIPKRLALAAYGLVFYLYKTVLPVHLVPLYQLQPSSVHLSAPRFFLPMLIVAAATIVAVRFRKRFPALLVAWAAYCVTLLPVLGIFQTGPQLVADRYSYLACLGWALLAGAGFATVWRKLEQYTVRVPAKSILAVSAGLVVICLGVLTAKQAQIWHCSEELWLYTVAVRNSSVAETQLGMALAEQHRMEDAIVHFGRAVEIDPLDPVAVMDLGEAVSMQGRTAQGIPLLERALKIDPGCQKLSPAVCVAASASLKHARQVLAAHSRAAVYSQ